MNITHMVFERKVVESELPVGAEFDKQIRAEMEARLVELGINPARIGTTVCTYIPDVETFAYELRLSVEIEGEN